MEVPATPRSSQILKLYKLTIYSFVLSRQTTRTLTTNNKCTTEAGAQQKNPGNINKSDLIGWDRDLHVPNKWARTMPRQRINANSIRQENTRIQTGTIAACGHGWICGKLHLRKRTSCMRFKCGCRTAMPKQCPIYIPVLYDRQFSVCGMRSSQIFR